MGKIGGLYSTSAISYSPIGRGFERPVLKPLNYFGWDWPVPDSHIGLIEVSNRLFKRGHIFNVWKTPQVAAVSWLLNVDEILPENFREPDWSVAFLFQGILLAYDYCYELLGSGDIRTGSALFEKINTKLSNLKNDYYKIPLPARQRIEYSYSSEMQDIAHSYDQLLERVSNLSANLQNDCEFPMVIHEELSGKPISKRGSPPNWQAEMVARIAVDIYKMATLDIPIRNSKKPSFNSFLERFIVDLPAVQKADTRRLSRMIWDDSGYKGYEWRGY